MRKVFRNTMGEAPTKEVVSNLGYTPLSPRPKETKKLIDGTYGSASVLFTK